MDRAPFRLDGRRALITGGSRGIGLAAATLMRELGAEITLVARTEDTLRAAAQDIGAAWAVADISSQEGVDAALEAAGAVDILVANAGGPPPALPSAVTEQAWNDGYHTTFLSTVRLAAGVLPGMRQRGWGRVLAVTSMTVGRPVLNLPVSNALRAAVTNHLRTLSLEVGRDGVTCNTVAPGYTATQRLRDLHTDPAQAAALAASIPLGRFAEPREVAAALAFLASDEAAYITGQELLVDGGHSV